MNKVGKLRGGVRGVFERWKNYWVGVGRDYKDATTDLLTASKQSPIKTTIVLGTGAFLGYCVKKNPTLEDYKTNFVENGLDLLLTSESIRNSRSENLHNYISRAINGDLIRRNNYGIFSIIWVDDFASELGVFASQCEYTKPSFRDLRARLIDVGFLGRWWISSRKMKDYDVNSEEWDETTQKPAKPETQLKQIW
eukprot:TRINITY_DN6581_c0_g1_i3.p1 TRINITY_DN6581_c0_g1~~TRINITY_DN6581_c0_g1_i3.p1  ORF type:complete len:195 (-),score=5.66 TRINITY_DN6581_c0_g1_i3:5-589(-)